MKLKVYHYYYINEGGNWNLPRPRHVCLPSDPSLGFPLPSGQVGQRPISLPPAQARAAQDGRGFDGRDCIDLAHHWSRVSPGHNTGERRRRQGGVGATIQVADRVALRQAGRLRERNRRVVGGAFAIRIVIFRTGKAVRNRNDALSSARTSSGIAGVDGDSLGARQGWRMRNSALSEQR